MRALSLFVLSILCLSLAVEISTATLSGNERDHAALLAFKSRITRDPQGALSSWNNSLHFCNWEGIICSHRHRRVTTLDLSSKGLVGTLSPSIGNLSFLHEIILSDNKLQGILAQELGHLFRLKVLILTNNNLEGEIPSSISHCSNLIQLSLANNRLTGKVPVELALLSKLQQLVLDFNSFTGVMPPFIGSLSSLQVLSATENAFTGYVSIDFRGLPRLQKLRLGRNNLGGGGQGDLNFLGALTNCSSLQVLELGDNKFGGLLPSSIANISTALTTINLAGNRIGGSIPSEISRFINLIYLNLGSNKFTGNIPDEIVKLRKLQRLVLSNNKLVGKIPVSIGNLLMLDQLQFDNNKLEGNIPPSFGNCRLLVFLDLSRNNLSGAIPDKLFDTSAFSIMLNLSQNYLVGSIPVGIGRLETLGEFDVSENKLSGVIPNEIGGCTGLEKLYVQGNFIQGSIPPSMWNLKGIQDVDFSRNNFSGQIPDFMQLMSLKYLNLSWNSFEGEVPVLGVFENLEAFSVVGNKRLCGGIPQLQLPRCSFEGSHKHNKTTRVVIIVFMVFTLSVFTMVASYTYLHPVFTMVASYTYLGQKNRKKEEPDLILKKFMAPSSKVSFRDLHRATNGFSSTNLVGAGGYGSVYKGVLDRTHVQSDLWYSGMLQTTIAVKVFNPQRRGAAKSFIAECEALRNIRHRNLVKIITACSSVDSEGKEFRAIVYEFMENGSLEKWLYSQKGTSQDGLNNRWILNLSSRINIAIDVASALNYLHDHCDNPVIHCDLKPNNILLDKDMVARVADFGLAKLRPEFRRADRSSIFGFRGTVGYAAPEYGIGSMASTKGDVYSFGIFLLEMLTGKKPTSTMFHGGINLHNFAWMALSGSVMDIIDTGLKGIATENEHSRKKMEECLTALIKIGVACSMASPQVRPNMKDVLRELQSVKKIFSKYRWANSDTMNATYNSVEYATWDNGTTTETQFQKFEITTQSCGCSEATQI